MADYLFNTVERLSKDVKGRAEVASYKNGITNGLCSRLRAIKNKDIVESDSRALVVDCLFRSD